MILNGNKSLLGLGLKGTNLAVGVPKEFGLHHKLLAKEKIEYLADEVLVFIPANAKINREKLVEAIQPVKEE